MKLFLLLFLPPADPLPTVYHLPPTTSYKLVLALVATRGVCIIAHDAVQQHDLHGGDRL